MITPFDVDGDYEIMYNVKYNLGRFNVAAGIMTRSAPQLNLFSFVFPVTILSAFIILYFSTGTMALAFSDLIFSTIEALEDLMIGISDG